METIQGVIIVGGGHGIGLSLTKVLLEDFNAQEIIATYRDEAKASELLDLARNHPERLHVRRLDPLSEEDLAQFSSELLEKKTSLRLLLNTCGFLHDENFTPEKRLKNFKADYFLKSMEVNALITPLLLSSLGELIPKDEESMVAVLSAKVGSISDNKLGGWYSYRASKAALNMLIKTAAIEYARTHKKLSLLAIHPGTTETPLSAPYLGGTNYKVHAPEESARNILYVLQSKTSEETGRFYSWDGSELPW